MLSKKAKYAIRALTTLSESEGLTLQIKTIASRASIPHKFLETIMQELKNSGFVGSKRGVAGGYLLVKPADKIFVGGVIRSIDGSISMVKCASVSSYERCSDCIDEKSCAIRKVMIDVRNSMSEILDNVSILDLSKYSAQELENFNFNI
jgi:Rrf2 family protein